MKGTKIIKEVLKQMGNTTLFGYPGGAIMPFFDEIHEDPDINFILMRHEQMAGHAAEGYARASGKIGVAVTTSGPGATNIITALANAYYDSSPLLVFSGQVSSKLIGNDAFQEADVIGASTSITKHNYQVKDVNKLEQTFREALYIAETGRPGPVFIDLPKDIQTSNSDSDKLLNMKVDIIGYNPREFSYGAQKQIKKAVDVLFEAQYPVIIAGGGIVHADASNELLDFVNLMQIPVVYTLMGKGCISDDHPYVLGMLGMHGRKRSNFAIAEADVILAIGTRFSDRITGNLAHFPCKPNTKVIHVDIDTAEIGKNVSVDIPIVADAKLALEQFILEVKNKISTGNTIKTWWPRYIKALKESSGIPNVTKPGKTGKIMPEKVMYELNQILDPDDIVATEVGQNQMYAAHYLNIRKPHKWISSGGLGTMGFGFPAAIGAKVAMPNSEVWLVAGDGSFQMNLHELATVKQHNIKVNILILNNQYLGMVRQWQELYFNKRYASTCLHCQDNSYWPDFVKLAEAYGLKGIRVQRPEDVAAALKQVKAEKETVIVDFMIEPESNILPMLLPGGALDTFIDRRGIQRSIYEWYPRLPRNEAEAKEYKFKLQVEDDILVYNE